MHTGGLRNVLRAPLNQWLFAAGVDQSLKFAYLG
jgi:hypothetical protein